MDAREPTSLAVALRWDGAGAPQVVAKGSGEVAERIIALAQEHRVPLREDPTLVAVLSQLDLDQRIPERLYIAVAEVIAFAYALQGRRPDARPAGTPGGARTQGAAAPARANASAAAD
jgi:flagellar biosynthesis protein